ncbi:MULTISPECIES: phage portal protein [Amycolatopsis]|uniref:phage portal protein n=1 Tax=Amycolatopsis TaxID=1813 RepID=UPI000B8AC533|nr:MULTISPECIES: phage portal protein [Amycolatopsis]OXM73081.1 phage portal protein [Amycolatopsis sp. KNN50.9b]
MGLGRLFTRAAGPRQHSRTIVSDGWRIGPSALITGDTGWGGGGYVRVLGIPGVDRAVMLIADLLGGLPWDAYTDRGRNYAEKVTPRPILLEQPNPEEARIATMSAWAADLVLNGNAIGVIAERNAAGLPTAVAPVPARNVGVRRAGGSTYSALPTGAIEYSIGGLTFAADEVIHVKGPCEPGALRGVGVLEKHLNGHGSLDLAEELARQARNLGNTGIPTGVLKATSPDVTREQLTASKEDWIRSQRDRTIAALGPSTEFQALAWNPEELQLIEARKLSLLEVANIFGLPPRFLGAPSGGSMDYTNAEAESIDLLKFSLGGHVGRFEQTLSLHFPRGTWVQANLDAVLRADTLTRYQAHEIAVRNGWLLKSEVREIEDYPPVPGIDDDPEPVRPAPHGQASETDEQTGATA